MMAMRRNWDAFKLDFADDWHSLTFLLECISFLHTIIILKLFDLSDIHLSGVYLINFNSELTYHA